MIIMNVTVFSIDKNSNIIIIKIYNINIINCHKLIVFK